MQNRGQASSWRGYVGLSLVWLVVVGVALFAGRRPSVQPIDILPPPTSPATVTPEPSPTARPLRVDVTGAVYSPGVYALPPGSIVADALTAAGGATADAALDLVNKAVSLQDGMQINVPRIQSAGALVLSQPVILAPAPGLSTDPAKAININTATPEELDTLPGIGPALTQRIIAGRPYSNIEDLLRVQGIGPATFEKLKERITVQ